MKAFIHFVFICLVASCTAHYMPPNHWHYNSQPWQAQSQPGGQRASLVAAAAVLTPVATAAGATTGVANVAAAQSSPVSTSAAPIAGSASATGGTTGGTYTGDITHYDVGLGSCGRNNTNADAVCALSIPMMANGPNPNTNPKCFTTISITNPSNPGAGPWTATIVDTCQACAYGDVDLSPSLFSAVAPTGNGRVSGITWSFA